MNKKLLKQKRKQDEKKKKKEETKIIMKSLEEANILNCKKIEQLTSIQTLSLGKQSKKKTNPFDKISQQEEEPEICKKIDQKPQVVNIFEQINFTNDFKMEIEQKPQQSVKYTRSTTELEIQAKRLFPELNFDTFEKTKQQELNELKRQEENENNSETQQEIIDYTKNPDDISDIEDDDLISLLKEYSYKNLKNSINRTEEHQKSREQLPIYMRESEIIVIKISVVKVLIKKYFQKYKKYQILFTLNVDAINGNLVTIICGQTGSGKSTQLPQFLYEAGYGNPEGPNPGKIAITQPRRLAAIALAERLSCEMNVKLGTTVSYQVRHDSSGFDESTKIKFFTDGILMNEIASDFLLQKYSIIMIDEAHERKINTDLLLGLLSRIINIRLKLSLKNNDVKPLRLVIMSATLRVSEFTENKLLFMNKKVPVIDIETRQFPVEIHYNKMTPSNYVDEAVKKCVKIHSNLPQGHILVFLTGEREIKEFCYKLKNSMQQKQNRMLDNDVDSDDDIEEELKITEQDKEIMSQQKKGFQDFLILPLYSKLPQNEQQAIFSQNAEHKRMIVASTNIAETSLTIPQIKYVVDAGKQKKKVFKSNLSITQFQIDWISQASADQRAGRAGRTGPGYCYRLYSTSVYSNYFMKFSPPEIIGVPLENVVLQLKVIGIKNTLQFPFPTPPEKENLMEAINNLKQMNALKCEQNYFNDDITEITELGITVYVQILKYQQF